MKTALETCRLSENKIQDCDKCLERQLTTFEIRIPLPNSRQTNVGSYGFEQDNPTLATIYTDISGMDINPATPVDLGGSPNSTDTKE
jgi:hypothetical protein